MVYLDKQTDRQMDRQTDNPKSISPFLEKAGDKNLNWISGDWNKFSTWTSGDGNYTYLVCGSMTIFC